MESIPETQDDDAGSIELEPEGHYLTPAEVGERLNALINCSADLKRLSLFIRSRVMKLKDGSYLTMEQDILHDVLERIISGSRRCPRHISMLTMVAKTASSIIDQKRKAADPLAEYSRENPPANNEKHDDWLASQVEQHAQKDSSHILCSKEAADKMFDELADDPVAQELLLLEFWDDKPAKEIQDELKLSSTTYQSKRRKITRRLAKLAANSY